MNKLNEKIIRVSERLAALKRVVVAFSGGKDSFFLLNLALQALGKDNVIALSVSTLFSARNDERRIDYFKRGHDFNLKKITVDISKDNKIMSNSRERCYYCKLKIFDTIKKEALRLKIESVLDGTTYSDLDEYRPGLKALKELGILSPLEQFKITSEEIVASLQRHQNIEDYYVTSSTCLATRFPYFLTLNEKLVRTFDNLENYFVELGIYPIKVRYIPEGIRIETSEKNFPRLLESREKVLQLCKGEGLKFITLDIEGIKTGVWD
jgi:uncharacterized protein